MENYAAIIAQAAARYWQQLRSQAQQWVKTALENTNAGIRDLLEWYLEFDEWVSVGNWENTLCAFGYLKEEAESLGIA